MQYKVIGSTMPAVEVLFDRAGESMYTQSGGMAWMSEGIEMNTNTNGGILKGVGRMFAGESMFMANYTAKAPGGDDCLCIHCGGRDSACEYRRMRRPDMPERRLSLCGAGSESKCHVY